MLSKRLGVIGAGNMAQALVAGLVYKGWSASDIYVSNPSVDKLNFLKEKFGVHISQDNNAVAQQAEILLLAVKPQKMTSVCAELQPIVAKHKPLVISVATGITTTTMQQALGATISVIRAMPNTPVVVGKGVTALFAGANASIEERRLAEAIFLAVGITVWLNQESQMDIATAVSGSGPAYIFFILEAMQKAAVELGLDEAVAKELVAQMCLGATEMALQPNANLESLRQAVTPPQGTTARALAVLQEAQVPKAIQRAINAACQRAQELSQSFGS